MNGKLVSVIMLSMLVLSALALVVNVQPAWASGTVYIRADGSVDPSSAPISNVDNILYTLTGHIYDSIVIERDNIVVEGAGYNVTGSGGGTGIGLTSRSNVTVRNTTINNFANGIYLYSCSNNTLSGNNVTGSGYAIFLGSSTNNVLSDNNVTKSSFGIWLESSSSNVLSGNNVSDDLGGIYLWLSCNNNTLSGNSVSYNGNGIYLNSSSNNVLSGNNVMGCSNVGIQLESSSNNVLSGNNVANNYFGIYLSSSSNNVLSGNNVANSVGGGILLDTSCNNVLSGSNITANGSYGIYLYYSSNNALSGNNVTANSDYGIYLWFSCNNNTLSGNNVSYNGYGIYFDSLFNASSSYNFIFHNSFVNNTQQVYTKGSNNTWDNGYPSGGNYWSNYTSADVYDGPYQNITGSDGIGDTPYIIDGNNRDNYPLVKSYPWAAHDVGITSIATNKNVVGQGYNVSVNVMIFNYGNDTETTNVTICANSARALNKTVIGETSNVALTSRNFTIVPFTWNTTGFAYGNYTINAYAWPVLGETDTADNNLTSGTIYVGIPGDINHDGTVNILDAIRLGNAFLTTPGSTNWNPNADINGDNIVNILDAIILGVHFLQHYP